MPVSHSSAQYTPRSLCRLKIPHHPQFEEVLQMVAKNPQDNAEHGSRLINMTLVTPPGRRVCIWPSLEHQTIWSEWNTLVQPSLPHWIVWSFAYFIRQATHFVLFHQVGCLLFQVRPRYLWQWTTILFSATTDQWTCCTRWCSWAIYLSPSW